MAGTGTLAVTPGSGSTINTLPPSGQDTPAHSLPVVLDNTVETAVGTSGAQALTIQGSASGVPVPVTISGSSGSAAITVEPVYFDALTAGTGYNVGDVLARVLFTNTSTQAITSVWYNMIQGTVLTTAPTIAPGAVQEQTKNVLINYSALPNGAATSAKQPALGIAGTPSADVLTVQGNASGMPLPISAPPSAHPMGTPAASALTYTAGKCIGGPVALTSFVRAAGLSALVQSGVLRAGASAITVEIDAVLFRGQPTVTAGLSDGATFAVAAADIALVSKIVKFTVMDSLGNGTLSNVDGIGKLMGVATGTTAYVQLVARGSVTLASASDLSVSFGLSQD